MVGSFIIIYFIVKKFLIMRWMLLAEEDAHVHFTTTNHQGYTLYDNTREFNWLLQVIKKRKIDLTQTQGADI